MKKNTDFSLRCGDKIKIVRQFRGMTQRELAEKVGLGENGASRIAQYEMNYRVPKESMLRDICGALHVSHLNMEDTFPINLFTILMMLMWLDEVFPDTVYLSSPVPYAPETPYLKGGLDEMGFPTDNVSADSTPDSKAEAAAAAAEPAADDAAAGSEDDISTLCTLRVNDKIFNELLTEWWYRKQQLKNGEITEREYREWKFSFPMTSDRLQGFFFRRRWQDKELFDANSIGLNLDPEYKAKIEELLQKDYLGHTGEDGGDNAGQQDS